LCTVSQSRSISVPSAVKYQADIILKIKKINEWKKKDEEKKERQIGHILDWEIVHNAIGPPPTGVVTGYLEFGKGIGLTQEIVSLGVDLGLIPKSGSWFTVNEERIQGENNVGDYLDENPDIRDQLYNDITSIFLDEDLLQDYYRTME
jgi:recombination protein RecA